MDNQQIKEICDKSYNELLSNLMPYIENELNNQLKEFSNSNGKISSAELSQALCVFAIKTLVKFNKDYLTLTLTKLLSQNQ